MSTASLNSSLEWYLGQGWNCEKTNEGSSYKAAFPLFMFLNLTHGRRYHNHTLTFLDYSQHVYEKPSWSCRPKPKHNRSQSVLADYYVILALHRLTSALLDTSPWVPCHQKVWSQYLIPGPACWISRAILTLASEQERMPTADCQWPSTGMMRLLLLSSYILS